MDPAERTVAPAEPTTDEVAGPIAVVERDGVRYTILGTAHVSKASASEVRRLAASGRFDAVAVELDANRHASLVDPDRIARTDLFQVLRRGQAGAMAANLALGAFQQRLADQLGIEPGAEMREAIRGAEAAGLPLLLIDRDIGVTLRRVYRNVPWWRRLELMAGLLGSVMSRQTITEEEIEKLKEGDLLEATFAEFAESSQRLYLPLITERDAYMAARLEQEAAHGAAHGADGDAEAAAQPREVLVVVGAGHLKGLRERLEAPAAEPPEARLAELDRTPPRSRWAKALPWLVVGLIVTGFVTGFVRDPQLGAQLLSDWFWINGIAGGLGTTLALAHPLTVVGTVLAAPLTSLNPLVGAGFVAAGLELWLRKPSVGDFATLRRDTTQLRGWYRNRVARTLLVFLGATLGSALGTYLAGARILTRLF